MWLQAISLSLLAVPSHALTTTAAPRPVQAIQKFLDDVTLTSAARVATEEKRFSSTEEPAEKKKENAFPRVAAARLPVPLVAFGARGDARYDPAQLSAWRDVAALDQNALTDRGDRSRDPSKPERFERFLERWFPGGRATPHRLLLDRPDELVRFLNEALRS